MGTVGQYQPTAGVLQRKGHNGGGYKSRKSRHSGMPLPEPNGQSGKHTVEECEKVKKLRKEARKRQKMGEWQTRHLRNREKRKRKEKDKEEQKGEKMESLFCSIYEFPTDAEKFESSLCSSAEFAADVCVFPSLYSSDTPSGSLHHVSVSSPVITHRVQHGQQIQYNSVSSSSSSRSYD